MTLLPITKRITTRREYDVAQVVIGEIMDAINAGDRSRRDELDLLLLLTKDYENSRPSALGPAPKSHEMVEFFMDQHGDRQADLVAFLGISRSAMSSILAGRIRLPRAAAAKLSARYHHDFVAMIAAEAAARPVRKRRPADGAGRSPRKRISHA